MALKDYTFRRAAKKRIEMAEWFEKFSEARNPDIIYQKISGCTELRMAVRDLKNCIKNLSKSPQTEISQKFGRFLNFLVVLEDYKNRIDRCFAEYPELTDPLQIRDALSELIDEVKWYS